MRITITLKTGQASAIIGDAVVHGYTAEIADAPALTGSPKQIEWAERIREQAIRDFAERRVIPSIKVGAPQVLLAGQVPADVAAALEQIAAPLRQVADKLATVTAAKSWIDARNADGKGTLDTVTALLRSGK